MPQPRRFPPPWSVIEFAEAFAVVDANGQRMAYVYFAEDASRDAAEPPVPR